eukprot:9079256-Pyramimonas_sp.AAC.1
MVSAKKVATSFSWLDRVYTSIPAGLLLDLAPSSGAIGCAADVAPLSDHAPVFYSLAPTGKSGAHSSPS